MKWNLPSNIHVNAPNKTYNHCLWRTAWGFIVLWKPKGLFLRAYPASLHDEEKVKEIERDLGNCCEGSYFLYHTTLSTDPSLLLLCFLEFKSNFKGLQMFFLYKIIIVLRTITDFIPNTKTRRYKLYELKFIILFLKKKYYHVHFLS